MKEIAKYEPNNLVGPGAMQPLPATGKPGICLLKLKLTTCVYKYNTNNSSILKFVYFSDSRS